MGALDLTLGPILLGTVLNVLLYGILITQVSLYFVVHKQDKAWVKIMVIWLLLLDTLNSVFDIGFIYRYTINLFGDFEAIRHSHWLLYIEPLMTVAIASTVQCFFAWRVAQLTGRQWIGWAIVFVVFIQFLGGAATTVGAWMIVDFARFGELKAPIIVWLVMSAVADVAITFILTWYLHSHRTGFPQTDDVITRIIRLTIQTGFITTLWALIDLCLYLAIPYPIHLLFNLPLCKLYTNSLMSTLNSRGGWGSGLSRSGVSETSNGISIHVSAVRECDRVSGNNPGSNMIIERMEISRGLTTFEANEGFELTSRTADLEGMDEAKVTSPRAKISNEIADSHIQATLSLPKQGEYDSWSDKSRSLRSVDKQA